MVELPDKVKGCWGKTHPFGCVLCKSGLQGAPSSDRVINIDETMHDAEVTGQPFSQRTHTITLGGMMPRGKIVNAALTHYVHRLLGNLATDEGIQPLFHGRLDVGLRGTGTPANPAYQVTGTRDMLW